MSDWLNLVDEKRRKNMLGILQVLSNLQDKENLNFIIIGAIPLLIKGYFNYTVYWDIDLLFPNVNCLRDFINKPKPKSMKIVNYDEDLMISENITSFHTAWAMDRSWMNVDYIMKGKAFEFYVEDTKMLELYTETIRFSGTDFHIALYFAHPWDVILEKILSPRTEKEADLRADMSVDIRHIYVVYRWEADNVNFWQHIFGKAKRFNRLIECKRKLLYILQISKDLGYEDINISTSVLEMLESS